jgi:hypothetical protein
MEPIKKGQLQAAIETAYVVRLDTNETQVLSTMGDSYCHFFEPIIIGNYKIIFRLDWCDLDKHGNPTLDADFYDIVTNKKLKNKGERHTAHHTRTIEPNVRVYEWEFGEIKWPFKVIIHRLIGVKEEMRISDSASCKVIRNGMKVDN